MKIRYIVENTNFMDEVPETIVSAINSLYTNIQISKLGLTEEELQSITPNFEFSLEQTDEKETSGNLFTMMAMSIVLFYAIYFCAYQVSSSITTEKTSKIKFFIQPYLIIPHFIPSPSLRIGISSASIPYLK